LSSHRERRIPFKATVKPTKCDLERFITIHEPSTPYPAPPEPSSKLQSSLSLRRKITRQLPIIQSPRNTIKLQHQLINLPIRIQLDEVETTHAVSRRGDSVELPVPDDLVAARGADVEGFDIGDGWATDDAADPFGFIGREAGAGQLVAQSRVSGQVGGF